MYQLDMSGQFNASTNVTSALPHQLPITYQTTWNQSQLGRRKLLGFPDSKRIFDSIVGSFMYQWRYHGLNVY
jgi:hypothetical protein